MLIDRIYRVVDILVASDIVESARAGVGIYCILEEWHYTRISRIVLGSYKSKGIQVGGGRPVRGGSHASTPERPR